MLYMLAMDAETADLLRQHEGTYGARLDPRELAEGGVFVVPARTLDDPAHADVFLLLDSLERRAVTLDEFPQPEDEGA